MYSSCNDKSGVKTLSPPGLIVPNPTNCLSQLQPLPFCVHCYNPMSNLSSRHHLELLLAVFTEYSFDAIGLLIIRNFFSDPYDRPQKWGWVVVIASWIVLIPVVGVLSSFGTIVSALTEEFNATKLEAGKHFIESLKKCLIYRRVMPNLQYSDLHNA